MLFYARGTRREYSSKPHKHDMLCYITHIMRCYITHAMLCYITHNILCQGHPARV